MKIKKVYLSGGMKSNWQDRVMQSCPEFVYFDPRGHGLVDPKEYTKWDLEHVDKADIVFAFMGIDNPSGFGMCLEIGYAHAKGIPIIFVDETNNKYFAIVKECCLINETELEGGIMCLSMVND